MKSRKMEQRRESDAKYKRLSIQGKTGKEVDIEICGTIQDRGGSIEKCSEVEISGIYEDLSSGKH